MERTAFGLNEVKFADDSEKEMLFSGYGAVFGNVDSYGDVIQPGAFADSLSESFKSGQYPAMLLQHGGYGMSADDMTPIGIWTGLSEDGHGLKVEGKLADTPRGREAYTLMKMAPRPAITGLSIGYVAKEWAQRSKPEEPRRTLKKIDLHEVSLVTFPANRKARISDVKSGVEMSDREFEQIMQDAGLSRKEARIVMNQGFRSLKAMQDAGSDELDELALSIKRNIQILSN